MRCAKCGHANRDGARFCAECAAPLATEISCASCGAKNSAAQKFCDTCGKRLAPGRAEARADPRAYTPSHLAEKILTSRSALEGEKKQVTVLFADIKGSMDLAESVDPEEWHRILDRFFGILSEGVHRFEGTINQYTGDGVMALFGAPIAHEDHARRACFAALHLTEELARYSGELRRTRGLNFSVRMGLNSGEVVVGKIGDDLRMDYTAQGRTVGLAARMEQLAAADRIYLTEHTAELVSGYMRLADLGPFEIKGAREPLRVFELQGVGPMRTRLDVARARGFSRFVGREAESAALDEALGKMLSGSAQVVAVAGEAGVGKSRLCYEFADRARARDIAVYEAHCVAHGKMVPFLPVLELYRGYFGITERDDDAEARKKIAGTLVLLDTEDFRETLPLLFDFLGVPDPEHPPPRMDPEARTRQLFAAVRRLARARSQREPAVLLFEDLHWIDGGSEAFLRNLVEVVQDTRTLIVVNYRPEYRAGWIPAEYGRELALSPLGPREISELVEDLLGRHASLDGVPDRIQKRTGGNPFFIEEVVQSLAENGTLEGTRGAYRLTRAIDGLGIPATVQAVLSARIDRLGDRDKTLLQTAAVIGKQVAEPVLERVAGVGREELQASLRALVASEFLYQHSLLPESIYAFKHPLTQEVAHASQLSESRARVHLAVARALQELYPEKLEPLAGLVAHHYERAGETLEAARWNVRAAAWAEKGNMNEALRHWRIVLQLLAKVPESPETTSFGLAARASMMSLGIRLGDPENEAATLFTEGKALAMELGDQRSLALLEAAYAGALTSAGEIEGALRHSLAAMRLATETGDPELKLALWVPLIYAHEVAGKVREALAYTEEALLHPPDDLRLGAGILGFSPYVWLVLFRGSFLVDLGRFREARVQLDRAIELARDMGELETLGLANSLYSIYGRCAGEADLTLNHARTAVDIAERIGSPLSRSLAYRALGVARLMREEWSEAAQAFQLALAIAHESRTAVWAEAHSLADLAEAQLGLGRMELARETIERARSQTRSRQLRWAKPHVDLTLARVRLRTEGLRARKDVEALLHGVVEISCETGFCPYEPLARLELAEVARLAGDAAGRERELREAHRLLSDMGATGYAERIARELEAFGSSEPSAAPAP